MPRFYCSQPLAAGTTVALPDAVAHHVWVLRLQPGAALTLFNGEGGEYSAQLATLDKKGATAAILRHHPREAELPYAVTLAQALPEAAKMDWILEKAVELGVASVAPLAAQRCVVRLSAERQEKRYAHWQAVLVAAAEQCGRNRLTALLPLSSMDDWCRAPATGQRLLLDPAAPLALTTWARAHGPRSLTLMVGPEGGFNEAEIALAVQHGAQRVSLGPRVLRTETAALAALATLAACWDDAPGPLTCAVPE